MAIRETRKGEEIGKADYVALAEFRRDLRRFLHFTEEGARAVGLTPRQHQLLLTIKGRPDTDWAHVADIAEALQIKPHAAVMLIDRCEHSGWVRRTTDLLDRRQVRVSLMPAGEEILARLSQANLRELRALRLTFKLKFPGDAE
jgi:DNA-binding MarR family transcriptional regulator